jgi:hypothetical protein
MVDRLDGKIEALNDNIQQVQQKLEEIEQKQQIQPRIERVLPPHKPESKEWRMSKGSLPEDSNIAWCGTTEGVAEALDEPIDIIEEGIETMIQEGSVSTATVDGDRRYWSAKHTASSGDRSISL